MTNSVSVRFIKGVGEKNAKFLSKLGIDTVGALLHFYPRKYLDFVNITELYSAEFDRAVCIRATIVSPIKEERYKGKNITAYSFKIKDNSGEGFVKLYNVKYLAASLKQGFSYLFYGKVNGNLLEREIVSPIIKPTGSEGFYAVYPLTEGITSNKISSVIKNALTTEMEFETLPKEILEKYNLCSAKEGLYKIHFPKNLSDIKEARRRFAFEELFLLQTAFSYLKSKKETASDIEIKTDFSGEFFTSLPFAPTNAQVKVTKECINDMLAGKQLNRLIQGDVGCGKTAVAAALCHTAAKNGYQAAIMVPTEVLAEQHFASFTKFFENFGIKCDLLVGSLTQKKKTAVKERLLSGETNIVIGTHAILSEDVGFANLGLVITDEQHRFGVNQRSVLTKKGNHPHTLFMSATPIPRTLAMIIYGELDISIIDEHPKNRQTIETYSVTPSYRGRIYEFIKKHIKEGRQAYIVCPAIEENENELSSATEYFENLKNGEFLGYRLGLLHGKLKPRDKEKVMKSFKNGEIDLLICTTVIEVGIDVPNAVLMVVENSERFGLSQLHQLRGRIGRGEHKSTCIFVSKSSDSARLKIMCNSTDGFKIADEDLKLRGPGDFIGKRQHGLPMLKIADLSADLPLMQLTAKAAKELLATDPLLEKAENQVLLHKITELFNTNFSA